MRSVRKIGKWLLYSMGVFMLILLCGFAYVVYVSKTDPPVITDADSLQWQRKDHGNGFYTLGNNWLKKSASGLFELYVEGDAFERGVVNGKLSRELLVSQEDYFSAQISKMIPSTFYLHFLKYVIGWFNRNLDKHIIDEYKQEIYGISESASDAYGYIGTNYQRILNYHAAHDIGHALQNMALVGCTSFGTWDTASEDSAMIIGRNFDFYVGDDFAKNKIILFENPSQGYKFMSVTWGGFIGVVSGMNEKGLTVTINAAKSSIPSGSATPVSLVAREILQYAATIDEAIAIAHQRTMFVSESFLVGSAADNKAVIIEKTPDTLDVYDPKSDHILCANHFQSKALAGTEPNIKQINESASAYRYKRLQELLQEKGKNTVQNTVSILRDRKGLHDANIGMGNEKALNQLIAHHAIVFEPKKLLVWVSTSPWQLGEFVAYDLNKIFALHGLQENREIYNSALTVAADTFLLTQQYKHFEKYRQYRHRIAEGGEVDTDSLVASNPQFYHTYVLAGDYCFKREQFDRAIQYYEQALTKEIATKQEEAYIRQQIADIQKKLQ
ncbi:C45 family peptidase [Agriterribacter sp.]|uniref:C45 family peptidase n=1 Tax=Agriterribacter sp. TaxID=2821509 RepID=UPI002B51AF4C|nr:C45 family peptidase [Agriterribacter sp.]HRO47625.1 C45 family autoproteolytic acyltransferase/hydrolase [Agriterribacter sp.]HRQ17171.1 C45 family autoproteolytic acyltransferase/hydrolase [Agriterribacter sp.]